MVRNFNHVPFRREKLEEPWLQTLNRLQEGIRFIATLKNFKNLIIKWPNSKNKCNLMHILIDVVEQDFKICFRNSNLNLASADKRKS